MNRKVNIAPVASDSLYVEDSMPGAAGRLIINADDWGRDGETTNRILDCAICGTISSVSAMVFMEDSERAAAVARQNQVDAGLHLNFTTPFSSPKCPSGLATRQQDIAITMTKHRFSRITFHPSLVRSFEYVFAAQLDEYCRLYGAEPERIDGHHHMHLCTNVLLGGLLPEGKVVRRNFSFQASEKSVVNRYYRKIVDRQLAKRHRLVDYLFSLQPLQSDLRLERILSLARESIVEVETHPVDKDEYSFLTSEEVFRWTKDFPIAPNFSLHAQVVGTSLVT